MIGSFKDQEAQRIYLREKSRRYASIERMILRKLLSIEAAIMLDKLRSPPANHLEALAGNRKGQHSVRISAQYRICFVWREEHAYEIEIVDHH